MPKMNRDQEMAKNQQKNEKKKRKNERKIRN